LAPHEGDGLFPVIDDVEAVAKLVVIEGFAGHEHITRIVLDQQHIDHVEQGLTHGGNTLLMVMQA
jgi:hypothetical protein